MTDATCAEFIQVIAPTLPKWEEEGAVGVGAVQEEEGDEERKMGKV